jgi:hypothetical protein
LEKEADPEMVKIIELESKLGLDLEKVTKEDLEHATCSEI